MKKETVQLTALLAIGIGLQGSLYQAYSLLMGGFIGVALLIVLFLNHKMYLQKNMFGKVWIFAVFSCFISMLFSVDRGLAFLGCLRILTIFIWYLFVLQFKEKTKDKVLDLWPYAAGIISVIGMVSFFIPTIKEWFWQANRYGGFFQYANTCALFLYGGIFVLMYKKEQKQIRRVCLFVIVSLGLYLTGSRSGIVLLLVSCVYWVIKDNHRKMVAMVQTIFLCLGGIVFLLGGSRQNIGRIFTIFTQNSTLYGRILYMRDAFVMMIKQPFGIGYDGFFWKQGSVQTGVYNTKFVHNDFLQMGLEYGIVFLVVVLYGLFLQYKEGKQGTQKKILLAIICGYSLFEFHLQYLSVVMLAVLLLDLESGKELEKKRLVVRENIGIVFLITLLLGYFGMAILLGDLGRVSQSIYMYPSNTMALENRLLMERDKNQAVYYAKEILRKNKYSKASYNTLAYACLMDFEYDQAMEYKLKVVMLDRYNTVEYQDYLEMAKMVAEYEARPEQYLKYKAQLIQIVNKTKDETSRLAWKIKESPDFSILD